MHFCRSVSVLVVCALLFSHNAHASWFGGDDDDDHDHDHDHGHDHDHSHDTPGADYGEDYKYVTCGSAIKLQHVPTGFRLHSQAINWGSGSGQQAVTAFPKGGDANSLWIVREAYGAPMCRFGTPIKCNDVIRLVHSSTRRHLHSHLHQSPVSHNQEISGYGNQKTGESDSGDNWRVQCSSDQWQRDQPVKLLHVDTGKYLYARKSDAFNENNCRNCPIIGQLEVTCRSFNDDNASWRTNEGVYFPVPQPVNLNRHHDDDDDEL